MAYISVCTTKFSDIAMKNNAIVRAYTVIRVRKELRTPPKVFTSLSRD